MTKHIFWYRIFFGMIGRWWPEPIVLEAGGMTVTVAPVGDYMEVADSIVGCTGDSTNC